MASTFFQRIFLAILAAITLGCGDSYQELTEDQEAWMTTVTEDLQSLADGRADEPEIHRSLQQRLSAQKVFETRYSELHQTYGLEEGDFAKRLNPRIASSLQDLSAAAQQVRRAGRMTSRIEHLLQEIRVVWLFEGP